MNLTDDTKKELDEITKMVPYSSVQLPKEPDAIIKPKIDINNLNQEIWGGKSNQLLSDYKYGEALATYGANDLNVSVFFKRFSTSICAIISNEFQKRGTGAEALKPLYNILESCMLLIAKEIEKKELKEQDILSIISALQGFITNYNLRKDNK